MQWLIDIGWLPARLKKLFRPPPCAGCLIYKAIRKPWRYKGEQRSIRKTTFSGECVSVDQLDSTTQGFVAQLKGWLTRKRYRYATVFVDHFSGANYIVPQVALTSAETVKAKHTFETWAKSNNVQVHNYHADNGSFQDNLWRQDCEAKGQGLTFSGLTPCAQPTIQTTASQRSERRNHPSRYSTIQMFGPTSETTITSVAQCTSWTVICKQAIERERSGQTKQESV
mmetsp:Transcript_13680/g.19606  ORF Transcript_13680/g.19606 Transcript_13680/m.19606 type:complete len:226 (+) Transcript_13680:554-1231(+)